jgi:hypothetical protein
MAADRNVHLAEESDDLLRGHAELVAQLTD